MKGVGRCLIPVLALVLVLVLEERGNSPWMGEAEGSYLYGSDQVWRLCTLLIVQIIIPSSTMSLDSCILHDMTSVPFVVTIYYSTC